MDAGTTRSRNQRGQGELLQREIIAAASRMLNELGDDEELSIRATAAVQACMDAGLAPADDAAAVALDLRSAVHGAVSIRINEPEVELPPLEDQVDRFLCKLVGVSIEHMF